MIITTNLDEVLGRLVGKLQDLNNPNGEARDLMLRQVASDTVAQVTYRIHTEGLNSAGKPIGEYANSYMKIRESSKYNRSSSKKIIFSLSGQMENDFNIVANQANHYGLGFKNTINADKAQWLQERFGRVYDLTEKEKDHANLVANDFIAEYLNG